MKCLLCSCPGFLEASKKRSPSRQNSGLPENICREFSLAEIKAATNNFHRDLVVRDDSFGFVYRGTVDDGSMVVSIKRVLLDKSSVGLKEFQNEVVFLCQLHHPHLISLIGFCNESSEMIVVFEYMSRGSLADYLYGNKSYVSIPWKQRLRICIGAARGLHYLHTGAKYAVIHRHIKSSNILLDDEWRAKLSDFEFSKRGPFSMSKAVIRMELAVLGTYGYAAPEYVATGEITEKSEVYSFGVVLFEVLLGRRAIDRTFEGNQHNMLKWSNDFIKEGTIYHVIDPYLKGKIAPECFKKYLEIASVCVHCNEIERPDMGEVEHTLELALELQEKADSEMKAINPHGESLYGEVFCAFNHNFGLYSNFI